MKRSKGVTLVLATALAGCGTHEKHTQAASEAPETPVLLPPTTSASPDVIASFKYFAVIRELGSKDDAALFGILPGSSTLQVTGVSGPAFLGAPRVGTLDQKAMDHLFLGLSVPLPPSERADLVAKYGGAQVIYFEKYDGVLCAGPDSEVDITAATVADDRKPTVTFAFTAVPLAGADCQFHTLATRAQD